MVYSNDEIIQKNGIYYFESELEEEKRKNEEKSKGRKRKITKLFFKIVKRISKNLCKTEMTHKEWEQLEYPYLCPKSKFKNLK